MKEIIKIEVIICVCERVDAVAGYWLSFFFLNRKSAVYVSSDRLFGRLGSWLRCSCVLKPKGF
jgi:hypothetical protein